MRGKNRVEVGTSKDIRQVGMTTHAGRTQAAGIVVLGEKESERERAPPRALEVRDNCRLIDNPIGRTLDAKRLGTNKETIGNHSKCV